MTKEKPTENRSIKQKTMGNYAIQTLLLETKRTLYQSTECA